MDNYFQKVTPESQGISSKKIINFIETIKKHKFGMQSFVLARNNKVISEGYCKPITKDFIHRIYSCSKSIVSLAIGKLYGEGKIKLTDKLVDYFPEYKDICKEEFAKTTIEDALTMRICLPTTAYGGWKTDWIKSSFVRENDYPNGMIFRYNSSASYLLDVIVEKMTGMTFLEYLRPEFDKIGVSKNIECIKSPDGYSWGASGVLLTTIDFAKIGNLILNKGKFNGEQLLPYDYMQKATSKITDNATFSATTISTTGYGYQIWIDEEGFSLHGMLGQQVHCLPLKNLMLVYNAIFMSNYDNYARNLIYDMLMDIYESASDIPLAEDKESYDKLNSILESWEIPTGYGKAHSDYENVINGKKFELCDNAMGFKWVKFDFNKDYCVFNYENSRGVFKLKFGYEKFIKDEFPEIFSGKQAHSPYHKGYDVLNMLSWSREQSMVLQVKVIDIYKGELFINVNFKDDKMLLSINKNTELYMADYGGTAISK